MFFANDFVHYLINLLVLLRNCYQNVINFGKDTAYLRNIKRKVTLLMSDFPYPCEYLYLFRSDFVSGYPII